MFMMNNKPTIIENAHIPARPNAPETYLHLKVVQNEEAPLGSRPVMFLLPGGPGLDHSTYQSYACLLDVVDIVFHDPRGCGKSEKCDPQFYTMENYVDDIEALRQFLSLDKIILAGKSYGSVCAMRYALNYHSNLEKLILAAGAASYRSLDTAKENVKKIANTKQLEMYEKLFNGRFKNHLDVAEFYMTTAPLYSHQIKTKVEAFLFGFFAKNFCYEATNRGFTTFLKTFDFEEELHKIRCNTLILAGEDDWINDVKHIKVMADKIPNNTFKVFPKAGHSIENDVGKPYFEAIRNFLQS